MGLTLKPNQLLSRAIRFNTAQGRTGAAVLGGTGGDGILSVAARKIKNLSRLEGQGEEGGLLQRLFNMGGALVGFIGKLVGAISFSVTAAVGWIFGRIEQIKAFDWNATDQELQQMIDGQNVAIASAWGNVVGQGIGWLAGIAVGYGIGFICPVIGGSVLARAIASRTAEEAVQEVLPGLRSALTATVGGMANNTIIRGYMNIRSLIKSLPLDRLSAILGGDTARWVKDKWGGEGEPDLSFNNQMDNAVESISNQALRAFVENALDEGWDSFMEAGFVIAQEIDDAYQQNRVAVSKALGAEKTVIVQPDVRNDDEQLTFQNVPQKLLIPTIQTALNQHRTIYNRDVGSIVGTTADEYIRARPQLRKLIILFRSRQSPPWRNSDGTRCKEVSYAIPDVKRGLTWQEIKAVASRFTWGKYRAVATLDNQRQMHVYGATAQEAEQKLRQLLTLSTASILRLTISEEEITPTALIKRPTEVYPSFGTLMARTANLSGQGRTTIDGRSYTEQIRRFELWTPEPPLGFEPLP